MADHMALKRAGLLYHRITQMLRLCLDGPYDPGKSLPALNMLVANSAVAPDIRAAESLLADTRPRWPLLFDRLVGPVS
jgi:[glutamine synthetase] adenylyltransferase / [glutamine synthetase]-adenylyl-L-tyrosine phosphorylase